MTLGFKLLLGAAALGVGALAVAIHIGTSDAGPITAKMLDDGTLEGEMSIAKQGRTKWTGERLQKR